MIQLTIYTELSTPNAVVATIASIGADYTTAVRNIANAGGIWAFDSSNNFTFVPMSQIVKIVAS